MGNFVTVFREEEEGPWDFYFGVPALVIAVVSSLMTLLVLKFLHTEPKPLPETRQRRSSSSPRLIETQPKSSSRKNTVVNLLNSPVYTELQVDTEFFREVDRTRQSKEFMLETANILHRSYCAATGVDCEEISAYEKERVAATYSPIPAVIATASFLALQKAMDAQRDSPAEGNTVCLTKQMFLDVLRSLSKSEYMNQIEINLSGLFSHSAWTAGLPYRDMLTSDFGHLTRPTNQSFFTLSQLEKAMTITMVARAARLLLANLDNDAQPEDGVKVFLGGACNPTTWRQDIAIPMLEKAGVSYFNPQVDEWTPDLVPIEAAAKANAPYLVFVINNQTRGLTSMIEATEFVSSDKKVFLVVTDVEPAQTFAGVLVNDEELKDLNRGRAYLRDVADRHNVTIFTSVEEATASLIKDLAGTSC